MNTNRNMKNKELVYLAISARFWEGNNSFTQDFIDAMVENILIKQSLSISEQSKKPLILSSFYPTKSSGRKPDREKLFKYLTSIPKSHVFFNQTTFQTHS